MDSIKYYSGEFWPQALVVFGSLGFAAVGLILSDRSEGLGWLFTSFGGLVFIAAALLTLIGNVVLWFRRPKIGELRNRVSELEDQVEVYTKDYYGQLRVELARVLRQDFGYGDTERISLFVDEGSSFRLLERYSENPEYDEASARTYYEKGSGVIGRAWEKGTAVEAGLPDPESDPDTYYRVLEDTWEMDPGVARTLSMQSRVLVGAAIYEPKGIERVGIVVVESTKVGIIKAEKVIEAVRGPVGERIYEFLQRREARSPEPDYAEEEGL